MFTLVSFLMHPVNFIKDYKHYRRHWDKSGYPKSGHVEYGRCWCETRSIACKCNNQAVSQHNDPYCPWNEEN